MAKTKTGDQPRVGYRTITPADAQKLLDKSKRTNRPLIKSLLERFVKIMKADQWDPNNSQAISIDWDGNVVNGHHRLRACIMADVPFTTLVVEGVPPETFSSEDTGQSRLPWHYLAIMGEKNPRFLAPAARALYLWDYGLWHMIGSNVRTTWLSNEQLADAIERFPVVRKGADFVAQNNYQLTKRMPAGVIAAMWSLTHGHAKHVSFWAEVVAGTNIDESSPVRMLRNRIDTAKALGHRVKKSIFVALLTKVWNAYASGDPIMRLTYRPSLDDFPQPITRLKPQVKPGEEPKEEVWAAAKKELAAA